MTIRLAASIATVMLILAAPPLPAATATSQTASMGLKSTLDKGVVSIMTDPTLSDGRLVLKVVALNPTAQPLELSAANVHVFTAAGKPVPLLSLDALIAEVRGSDTSHSGATHQSSNYSRPQTSTNQSGELDVTGISGASDAVGRTIAEQQMARRGSTVDDPAVTEQVEALKAGILQTATVEPGKVTGGQLVTDRIKFSRKEEKALRVVVDFNGEQHEFNFEAPPAK